MTRLDKFVIFLLAAAVFAMLVGGPRPGVFDPAVGRRPVPGPADTAAPPAPTPPATIEGRLRRPLPNPSPGDPLFTINVEPFRPGMVALGTSFSVGGGVWLTARHVANRGCRQVVLVVDGARIPAEIEFLHPEADLAVLRTGARAAPALPLSSAPVSVGETGFAFGFPSGRLGGTEDSLMGRTRMRLGGRLQGTGPVLTWAEVRRVPGELESLGGISGGPMLDENGAIVGIIVASSVRRGRNHTVAPEILRDIQRELPLFGPTTRSAPAREVATKPVPLLAVAAALSGDSGIAKTYCIPSS
jgi:serine protease Do